MLLSKKVQERQCSDDSEEGKNLSLPQNYRPISLLPTMIKTVERIIESRLENYTEERQNLSEHKFAFRKGLEAKLLIVRVIEKIKERFQRKDLTRPVLLDVDKVWGDGFIYKMNQMNVPRRLIHLLDFYFRDRTF